MAKKQHDAVELLCNSLRQKKSLALQMIMGQGKNTAIAGSLCMAISHGLGTAPMFMAPPLLHVQSTKLASVR
jgi:hypothetical protein